MILTKNEEINIGRLIQLSRKYFTDIHVLDSGSSDRTVKLALEHGGIVTTHALSPFIISDQRNWALKNLDLANEWVLFLDADEEPTDAFVAAVLSAVNSTDANGYFLAPKFEYQGTWLRRFMGYPNWHPRLVRQETVEFTGGVWETFSTKTNIGYIPEPYRHIVDSKGLTDWIERHTRYAEWEASASTTSRQEARRPWTRWVLRHLGPLRIPLSLSYHLFYRGGILDGGSVWSYARRHLIHQLLISEFVREKRRQALDA